MLRAWVRTVSMPIEACAAICALVSALLQELQHLGLARGEDVGLG